MKAIKTLLLLLLVSATAFSFCGCLQSMQLNERALVQAIGIDYENDELVLTMQIFSPSTSASAGISASTENAKIITARGNSISQAIENATRVQGKKLFIGHNRIIILGRSLAQKDITRALSYFATATNSRHNMNIAVAEGSASKIITAKINQGILPAETLERILENSDDNGTLRTVELYEFLATLENKHESAVLPMIHLKEDKSKEATTNGGGEKEKEGGEKKAEESDSLSDISSVEIGKMAVFTDGKMVGVLDDSQTRGLLFLQNRMNKATIIAKTDKYDLVSVLIYSSKSHLEPKIDGSDISFILHLDCRATVGETIVKDGITVNVNDVLALGSAAENVISDEINSAFEKAIHGYQADLFNLGNIVWKENSKLWNTIHGGWPDELKKIKLTTDINVTIERTGLEITQKSP